mmetsp:Transcript_85609/g.276294  ORF Transcript_85609/g.276294 Transcript_85609/m.276294 type:complete len:202 (+) Transcript_85609:103-708(+)
MPLRRVARGRASRSCGSAPSDPVSSPSGRAWTNSGVRARSVTWPSSAQTARCSTRMPRCSPSPVESSGNGWKRRGRREGTLRSPPRSPSAPPPTSRAPPWTSSMLVPPPFGSAPCPASSRSPIDGVSRRFRMCWYRVCWTPSRQRSRQVSSRSASPLARSLAVPPGSSLCLTSRLAQRRRHLPGGRPPFSSTSCAVMMSSW